MLTPLHLTPDGFQRLQRTLGHEYARLEEARRVVQEQMEAGEQENQGLEAAQREVMATLDRIAELEDSLAWAVVIERPGGEDDRAALGAVMTLLDLDTGRELRLQLVNPAEASATAGEWPRISTESPVGRELPGRRVGETFTVGLGRREVPYRVERVEF